MGDSADRYDRRTFLGRGAAAAGLAAAAAGAPTLLSACGASTPAASTGTTNPGVSRSAPRRGGSVTIGMTSEIDGFLPSQSHWDATGLVYANAVFDTLTKEAVDGSMHPYLASSVTPNADKTQWTVTLRPHVVFHDGSPLTADVVVQNYKALQASALTHQAVDVVTSVTAADELTLHYQCEEPLVAFPAYLSTQVGSVIALSQLDAPQARGSQHPIGTGPYRYVSWEPNDHFTVARNPAYWRQGLPYLDTVTFMPIIDDDSREASLRAGTIDLMVSADPGAVADLQHDTSFQQVTDRLVTGEPDLDFICLNTTVDPVSDLTVRQALAYATDIKELITLFGRGVTQEQTSLFPVGSPYRPADNGYPVYNLARAQALVKQAEAKHGGTIRLSLADINSSRQTEIIQALQSMWQKAGFVVTLSQLQQVSYIDNLVGGAFQAAADEQFSAADPDLNYVWLSPTTANPPIALNFARNKDARIETALQQGRTHPEKSVRVEAYQTVDKLLAQDIPYLWTTRTVWSLTGNDSTVNFAGPVLPDGTRGVGFRGGVFTPTQIWTKA